MQVQELRRQLEEQQSTAATEQSSQAAATAKLGADHKQAEAKARADMKVRLLDPA